MRFSLIKRTKLYKEGDRLTQLRLEKLERRVVAGLLTALTLYYLFMFIWLRAEGYTYTLLILNNIVKYFKLFKDVKVKLPDESESKFKKEFFKRCWICNKLKTWWKGRA